MKNYISKILFFLLFYSFTFAAVSQENKDTIPMPKNGELKWYSNLKRDYNKNKKLEKAMYGLYVNKPVEEIMNNRIKTLSSHLYCDCREDCAWGMRNLDTLVLNRGIDNLDHQLESFDFYNNLTVLDNHLLL